MAVRAAWGRDRGGDGSVPCLCCICVRVLADPVLVFQDVTTGGYAVQGRQDFSVVSHSCM